MRRRLLMLSLLLVWTHASALQQVKIEPPPSKVRGVENSATAQPGSEREGTSNQARSSDGAPTALALLAAGLGMVVYVGRRRQHD